MARGRPRLPTEKAKLIGADVKDAGRFKDRSDPKSGPIGPPPKHFDKTHKDMWREIVGEIPWLQSSDRKTLENLCALQVIIRTGDAPIAAFSAAKALLTELGATPSSRSRIKVEDDPPEDPADEFLQ
jgi:phage terminase small subunit